MVPGSQMSGQVGSQEHRGTPPHHHGALGPVSLAGVGAQEVRRSGG